jgi:hypothetical protein
MVCNIEVVPPTNSDEVLGSSLWYTTSFFGYNFGFDSNWAAALSRSGLTSFRDLWDSTAGNFKSWAMLLANYPLCPVEQSLIARIQAATPPSWISMLTQLRFHTQPGDWLGLFSLPDAELPELVVQTTRAWSPVISPEPEISHLPLEIQVYEVLSKSRILRRILNLRELPQLDQPRLIKRIRIASLTRGSEQKCKLIMVFARSLDSLQFDVGRWRWQDASLLLSYTAKKGRLMLHPRQQLERPMAEKWIGILPRTYTPNWKEVWFKRRPKKEAGFLWSVYHHVVAVNSWRAQISPFIDRTCKCCLQ